MYNLFWRDPSLPFTQKQVQINVPPGAVVTNAASIRLTGKGFTNYGKILQENLLRLLENFAAPSAPEYPTVGQLWYDTSLSVLKICVGTAPDPVTWEQINAYQVTDQEPSNPALGDLWFKPSGAHSGVLYMYTGIGRFPEKVWDAVAEGYYQQPSSPTLAARINVSSFSGVEGSEPGKFRLYGRDTAGLISDTPGSVNINGLMYNIPNDITYTAMLKNQSGYLMVDTGDMNTINSVFVNAIGAGMAKRVFFVVPCEDGTWVYDNGVSFSKFVPASSQYIFGILKTSKTTNSIDSVALWRNAVTISRFEKFVDTNATNGKCGGWEQMWPTVTYVGARDEYDAIHNKLMSLIGDPIGCSGSGAVNKLIDYVPNLQILDASLQTILLASADSNIFEPSSNSISTVKILPTSQDWDLLLAACRYAVNRLEVGADAVSDIPSTGFVQDGLPLHPTILNANPIDGKFLSSYAIARRTNTKTGMMSCFMSFQELMNVLDYANKSKHIIKGTYEQSASSVYSTTVVNTTHAVFSGVASNLNGNKTLEVTLPFSTGYDLQSFINSGGSFMMEVSASEASGVPSTASDLALQAALSIRGKIKVNGTNSCIFNYGTNSQLALSPVTTGFASISNGSSSAINTYTNSGITVSWSIGKSTDGAGLKIILSLTGPSTLTNIINVRASYIMDDIKYAVGTGTQNVFSKPLAFTAAHYTGTGVSVSPAVFTVSA